MSIRINVDPTNPGQFFACCGLLELADRVWPGTEGWFAQDDREFTIAGGGRLRELLAVAKATTFAGADDEDEGEDESADDDDDAATLEPLHIDSPVQLRLDWWADKSIKTWAGSMNVRLIAIAMCNSIDVNRIDPFNQSQIVFDPLKPSPPGSKLKKDKLKKREPFYFDAQRGPNAHSRDVGFSPNDLQMKTTASPAVEFLCLIGLQRCRPAPTSRQRIHDYFTWKEPLDVSLLPAAVSGLMPFIRSRGYRFENRFRSGQKKLKAYYPSKPLEKANE
jgi:CRISPR-associated protein Csb3